MKVLIKKQDRIDYIISNLCEYWNILESELKKNACNNPARKQRKEIAVYILRTVADLSLKDCGPAVGYSSSLNDMSRTVIVVREKLNDPAFKKEYDLILEYLGV